MAASTGAIRAGKAFVEIGADNSKLLKVLNKSSDRMKAFAANAAKIGGSLIAAGTSITAPLTAAVFSFSEAGDKLDKMSIRTGASVESLSALGFAAEQSGTSIDALGSGLFRMRRRIANATTGAGPAKRALDALGLSADELSKLDSDQQLLEVADSLAKVEDDSLAAQYAFEILGDGGKALLPLLQSGSDGINAMMLEAKELGLVVSQSQSKAGADFMDAWNRIKRSSKASIFLLGGELAPVLTDLAKHVVEGAKVAQQWIRENGHIIKLAAAIGVGLIALGGVILALSGIVYVAGLGVGLLAGAISFLGGVVSFLLSPLGLVTAALAGILYYSGAGGEALDWLSERFKSLGEFVSDTFGLVKKAMDAGEYELAAKLLIAAIQVKFYEGLSGITGKVLEWKTLFLDIWYGMIDQASKYMLDAWAWLQKKWVEIVDAFQSLYQATVNQALKITAAIQAAHAIQQIREKYKDAEKGSPEARARDLEIAGVQTAYSYNAAQAQKDYQDLISGRETDTQNKLNEINTVRDGAKEIIDEEAKKRQDAQQKKLDDALQESKDKVTDAKKKLEDLTKQVNLLPEPDKTQLVQNAKKNQNFAQSPTALKASGGDSVNLRSEAGAKLIADLFNQASENKTLKELQGQTPLLSDIAKILDERLLKAGQV